MLSEMVGHESLISRFQDSIVKDRLPSTLLFVGPSGVGKKKFALSLAQQMLCTDSEDGKACGKCGSCIRLAKRSHESLLFIEPENKMIKVEQAREVLNFLSLQGITERRFIIIDQAECLNPQAANALLKIFEEPPKGTHFVLLSSKPIQILSTVRSRCQTWRFGPLQEDEIQRIKEYPQWILAASQGSLDTAEYLQSEVGNEIKGMVDHLYQKILSGHWQGSLEELRSVGGKKENYLLVIRFFQQMIRDAMVYPWGDCIHHDQEHTIRELSQLSSEMKNYIFIESLNLEGAMTFNQDLGLNLEVFIRNIDEKLRS